jgi:hypothetical protein
VRSAHDTVAQLQVLQREAFEQRVDDLTAHGDPDLKYLMRYLTHHR